MPEKPISREYRIYLAIWRKALHSRDTIKIQCGSPNMAISMRQGMYRAIRPFRNGIMVDEELRLAADKFVVYIDKDSSTLEFRERLTLQVLDGLLDEIGIDENDLELREEREVKHSLAEFLNETPAIAPIDIELPGNNTGRKTPFYTRED